MTNKPTANLVADYIVSFCQEHGDCITNLRLQKLMYYAQAWHLALYGKRLFDGEFEAWIHGPVHQDTYYRFNSYRWNPISEEVVAPCFSEHVDQFLEEVIEVYGGYSSYQLERMVHSESPWQRARGGLPADAESTNVIADADMKEFYWARVTDEEKV